jgi:hypothetical protein
MSFGEQTPLFQVNLMIWMSMEQPSDAPVRPLFYEEGFELWGVSPTLSVPAVASERARDSGVPMQRAVTPEVVMQRSKDKTLLIVECKLNSFGPDVTNGNHPARQAGALLALRGRDVAAFIPLEAPASWQAHLLYAVGNRNEDRQQKTLSDLSGRLREADIQPLPRSSVGIHYDPDGIFLRFSEEGDFSVQPDLDSNRRIKVADLGLGDDPRPLYLFPYDPDVGFSEDGLDRSAFKERVRTEFAHQIGSRVEDSNFDIPLMDFLKGVYPIWEKWRAQDGKQGVRRKIASYIKKAVSDLREYLSTQGMDPEVGMTSEKTISFRNVSREEGKAIRRFLSTKDFRTGEIDLSDSGDQLRLEL